MGAVPAPQTVQGGTGRGAAAAGNAGCEGDVLGQGEQDGSRVSEMAKGWVTCSQGRGVSVVP